MVCAPLGCGKDQFWERLGQGPWWRVLLRLRWLGLWLGLWLWLWLWLRLLHQPRLGSDWLWHHRHGGGDLHHREIREARKSKRERWENYRRDMVTRA